MLASETMDWRTRLLSNSNLPAAPGSVSHTSYTPDIRIFPSFLANRPPGTGSQSMTPADIEHLLFERNLHDKSRGQTTRETKEGRQAQRTFQMRHGVGRSKGHTQYVKGSISLGVLVFRGEMEPPTTSTSPNPLGKRSTTKTRAWRRRFEIPQKHTPAVPAAIIRW